MMSQQSTAAGYGSVAWWGFTPALDLSPHCDRDSVQILLVGCGDLRHVMMTLASSCKKNHKNIHFYLMEGSLEIFARQMLFLSLFCEPPDHLGLQEKVELFLELYGNSLVRASTSAYLKEKATSLIELVTNLESLKSTLPFLDISALKFKERDFLEGIFKFWRLQDSSFFEIQKHWEGRLRHSLGARYDSRKGVFDWDYHMKLHDVTPVIAAKEYVEWRETGVAFQLRDDAPYQHTNRSLASGLVVTQGGERTARRGYWGDIVNSPYISFGIESENKELLKPSASAMPANTSVRVSEYNLLSLIHQLTNGTPYTAASKDITEVDPCTSTDDDHATTGPLLNNCCQVTLLPLSSASELGKKAKFENLFDVAYFSNSMVHHLVSGVENSFAPGCTLLLETANFMLDLKKEQKADYIQKITAMASAIGYTDHHCSQGTANHLVFTHTTSS